MATSTELAALSKDLEALRRDVAKLAGSLASQGSASVSRYAREYARRGASRAGAALDYAADGSADFLEEASERARHAADEVAAQVRRHPAIAFAGLLTIGMVAYLISGRHTAPPPAPAKRPTLEPPARFSRDAPQRASLPQAFPATCSHASNRGAPQASGSALSLTDAGVPHDA